MNIDWLIALLCPEDVASHPNYPDNAYEQLPHVMFAQALHPFASWRALPDSPGDSGLGVQATTIVAKCIQASTQREGIIAAAEFLSTEDIDVDSRISVCLVAIVAAAELEDSNLIERLFTSAFDSIDNDSSPGSQFAKAILLQQRALRYRDLGLNWQAHCVEAARAIREIRPSTLPLPQIRPGCGRDAIEVLYDITACLRFASMSLASPITGLFSDDEAIDPALYRHDEVTAQGRPSHLTWLASAQSNEYEQFVGSVFMRDFKTSSVSLFEYTPDFYMVQLQYELYGSGSVFTVRKELALLRLLVAQTWTDRYQVAECLRMLRSANSVKELRLAVGRVRESGPLTALALDARRILATRCDPACLREVDYVSLKAAASLLTANESATGLRAIVTEAEQNFPANVPGLYSSYSSRIEHPLTTACTLANRCDSHTEANRLLVDVFRKAPFDEIVDRNLARSIRILLRSTSMDQIGPSWNEVLSQRPVTEWTEVRSVVVDGETSSSLANDLPPAADSLEQAVALANYALNGGVLNERQTDTASSLVTHLLERERVDSARGVFSGGGYDVGSVGVILALHGGAKIWLSIIEYLCDQKVARNHRSDSFYRLAYADVALPIDVHRSFADRLQVMLHGGFESSFTTPQLATKPFAAAVAFAAKHRIAGELQACTLVSQLVADKDVSVRGDAARIIELLSRDREWSWLLDFSLQLTNDDDYEVRGVAASALVNFASHANSREIHQTAVTAVKECLKLDGIVVPMYILTKIDEGSASNTIGLEKELIELSKEHPSSDVRGLAKKLLVQEPDLA